jgi:cobalt-zinc-cadmium efflux system protein
MYVIFFLLTPNKKLLPSLIIINIRITMTHHEYEHHDHHHSHEHHAHVHTHTVANNNEKAVLIGFFITFLYMVAEFIGGYLTNSLSLTADAGHMLIDSGGLLFAWAAFYFGRRNSNNRKTFGYSRLEIIASLLNSVFLLILTFFIVEEAYERFQNPAQITAIPMLIISVIGLFVNWMVFYILNKGDKEHLNVKGAILHVLGDLLGSVAAIAAGLIVYFTGWNLADSILSVFVCLIMLRSIWVLFKSSVDVLMEGTPNNIEVNDVEKFVLGVQNVKSACHIHIWALTSGKNIATLEITVEDKNKIEETTILIKKGLATKFNIQHSTVGIDTSKCIY